jgi:hypothetical protein
MPHRPHQNALPLDVSPDLLMQEAERLRLRSSYWRQRYRTLDALLADPTRAHAFMTCARRALLARLQNKT